MTKTKTTRPRGRPANPAATPLGKLLREARGTRTIAQAAETVGVEPTTYGNWERGDRTPHFSSLEAIARGLGLTLDSLISAVISAKQRAKK